ncbi:MAG TPA: hypothetical protein VKB79_31115 [Bryobacteraceae bacterium]|nr:hypothetical protein [Bryobacteraceae bacterium]
MENTKGGIALKDQRRLTILTRKGKRDAVLLNLTMPGMDGKETFDRLREVDPATPVVRDRRGAISGNGNRWLSVQNRIPEGSTWKP